MFLMLNGMPNTTTSCNANPHSPHVVMWRGKEYTVRYINVTASTLLLCPPLAPPILYDCTHCISENLILHDLVGDIYFENHCNMSGARTDCYGTRTVCHVKRHKPKEAKRDLESYAIRYGATSLKPLHKH